MRLRLIAVSLGVTLLVLAQSACGESSISQEAASPTTVPGNQTSQSQPSLPASATAAVTPSALPSPKRSPALTPQSIDERAPASTMAPSEKGNPATFATKENAANPAPSQTAAIPASEPAAPPPPIGTKVGNRIPDFEIELVDGTILTSADLRQRRQPAFLFFHAAW